MIVPLSKDLKYSAEKYSGQVIFKMFQNGITERTPANPSKLILFFQITTVTKHNLPLQLPTKILKRHQDMLKLICTNYF